MRVLSVVHDPDATGGGGLFERVVVAEGHELERWVVVDGDAPPGDPAEWDAVMVFGGAMHPDQDAEHPWLPDEVGFIERTLEEGVPTIGVCLGSQLIARACGAWVGPAREPEVGWVAVEVNDRGAADPVLRALPRRVEAFQWHYYTFELPQGAVELASSAAARQAYRLGDRTWGVQFHAEIEGHMLERWFAEGEAELPMPLAEVEAETERKLPAWNEQGAALCRAFLDTASRVGSAPARPTQGRGLPATGG